MKLRPETIAAHQARHQKERQYPPHTLAPDPRQPELDLRPPKGCTCASCQRKTGDFQGII